KSRVDRPGGHRHDSVNGHPKRNSGGGGARRLRGTGGRAGGHLPRSLVAVRRAELGQRRRQGARAPVRGAGTTAARHIERYEQRKRETMSDLSSSTTI